MNKLLLIAGIGFVGAQAAWRFTEQSKALSVKIKRDIFLVKTFDLRDADKVMSLLAKRESDSFKERVRQPQVNVKFWPGIKAMQLSWVWMQALNGLHTDASFQGDYSWLFSKLDLMARGLPRSDSRSISVAPFFLVIGADGVGSTLLINDWTLRSADSWRTWFYAGFHALDNLKDRALAADYFEKSLRFKQTPDYIAGLAIRLKNPQNIRNESLRASMLNDLDPNLLERLKRVRPEWFKE